MVKIAAIDLGSNSTRLLIADILEEEFNILEKSHVVTKMAEGLEENGFISDDSRKRVIKTLKTFLKQIKKHEVSQVFAVGTAAMRDSINTSEFIDEIKRKIDIEVEVITGQQEGIITSLGVLHFMENLQNYLVIGLSLLLLGLFDIFSNTFLNVNITGFLPSIVSYLSPLILGTLGLHFIRNHPLSFLGHICINAV